MRAGPSPGSPVRLGTAALLLFLCAASPLLAQIPAGLETVRHGMSAGGLRVVYPKNGSSIDCSSTFLIGSSEPGSGVTCNGLPVKVNSHGYFAHVVKLAPGTNRFSLAASGREGAPLVLSVLRPRPPAALPPSPLKLVPDSAQPNEDMGVTPGDVIQFALRASPGAQAKVMVGLRTVNLYPVSPKGKRSSVNIGRDTAFGITFQRSPAGMKDYYTGVYKVGPDDRWQGAVPIFHVRSGKTAVSFRGKGRITVFRQPVMLRTIKDDTIVRLGPGAARTTPLPRGVRFSCDGFRGPWRRLELAPGRHVWINREDLEPDTDRQLVAGNVPTINIGSDGYGAFVRIPLPQRLPFQIEQSLNPSRLVLRVFGATADTDYVTADTDPEHLAPEDRHSARLIDHVSWRQKEDHVYELVVDLKHKRQWGFFAEYADTDLLLHVKSPPRLSGGDLTGCVICVDPGHGGKETGSIGCSGIPESQVNLAMAQKLKSALEAAGAKVVMTRTEDTDVSLADRVRTAIANRADILVSVHNNALPDGRNPWTEHGTSTYWYHPQSVELARTLKSSVVSATGLPDYGCRYQNLFLCRPTHMPASLVEVGFMIHPDEFVELCDPAFQQKAARGIADALKSSILDGNAD